MSITQSTELDEYDRLDHQAQATTCGVPDCDGTSHDFIAPMNEWTHRIAHETFDNESVEFDIYRNSDGQHTANISVESAGDVTAAELRDIADVYEGFPVLLRSQADRLDALNNEREADEVAARVAHGKRLNEQVADRIRRAATAQGFDRYTLCDALNIRRQRANELWTGRRLLVSDVVYAGELLGISTEEMWSEPEAEASK